MQWHLSQNKKRRGSEVAIEFENKAQFTWMCRWRNTPVIFFHCVKNPPVKQHMDCNVSLEPLTLPSCAHNPGFAHNVRWPRIGHLAEANDLWSNGQCQFLTFQCQWLQYLKEFDGRFPIGQCRALIWTGLVEDSHTKTFIQCQIVRRLVRDGEDIWTADINFNQSNI